MKYIVHDAEGMRRLGASFADVLRAGDLVILAGGLGAGKTTLVQGIGAGLGVQGHVSSPTFIIARAHEPAGTGPWLVHVDAYRLANLSELDHLDLDTSTDDSVTVVEWGEGKAESLADSHALIVIDRTRGGLDAAALEAGEDASQGERVVSVSVTGPAWSGRQWPYVEGLSL